MGKTSGELDQTAQKRQRRLRHVVGQAEEAAVRRESAASGDGLVGQLHRANIVSLFVLARGKRLGGRLMRRRVVGPTGQPSIGNGRALACNSGVVQDDLAGVTGLLVLARGQCLGGRLARRRAVVVRSPGPAGREAEREQSGQPSTSEQAVADGSPWAAADAVTATVDGKSVQEAGPTASNEVGTPPSGSPPDSNSPPDGGVPGGGPMGPGGEAGAPPSGSPPDGDGGPPGGGTGTTGSTTGLASATGAFTFSAGSVIRTGETYSASATDESGVYVSNGAVLSLISPMVTTTGNSSSSDSSSFYGLNAGVLVVSGGQVTLSGGTVTTSGAGANGVFAQGSGSEVTLSDVTITATGQYAHAAMASNGGTMTLTNVNMSTAGANSGAIATDRGGGTINVTGGTVTTSGQDSPGIYSTGNISVTGATITATGAEAAVIEGANSITLTDTALSSSKPDKWGVLIYQSMSGDAQGATGTFTMTGGTLSNTANSGPLFYVTNSPGIITLSHVSVTAASGTLVNAAAGNWGTTGANGGTVVLVGDGETLTGDLKADSTARSPSR